MRKNHSSVKIVLYDETDETLIDIFDNRLQLCKFLKIEPSRQNLTYISSKIFKAVHRKTHWVRFRGSELYRLYLIDMNDEEEENNEKICSNSI